MPRILCRYVLREVFWPTILALLALTFILLTIAKVPGHKGERLLLMLLRLFFRDDIPKSDVISIFILALPPVLMFILPTALLIGIIIGVGRMTMDLEIRAMETTGINLTTVFMPVIAFAALLSALMAFLAYAPTPIMLHAAMIRASRILITEISNLEPGRHYDDMLPDRGGLSFYFDRRDQTTREMLGVTMVLDRKAFDSKKEQDEHKARKKEKERELDQKLEDNFFTQEQYDQKMEDLKIEFNTTRQPITIFAARAAFAADAETGRLELNLHNGTIHILGDKSSPKQDEAVGGGEKAEIDMTSGPSAPPSPAADGDAAPIPAPALALSDLQVEEAPIDRDYALIRFKNLIKSESIAPDKGTDRARRMMTTPQHWVQYRDSTEKDKYRNRSLATILERYSLALECLVLAIIGIPLAVWVRPTGKSFGIVLAFALILVYHWLMRTGYSMIESGVLIGPLAIFLPNLLFVVMGSILWRRMVRV